MLGYVLGSRLGSILYDLVELADTGESEAERRKKYKD